MHLDSDRGHIEGIDSVFPAPRGIANGGLRLAAIGRRGTRHDPTARGVFRAHVDCDGESRVVDAAIEVQTREEYPPLDDFHSYLRRNWFHVQGWRVKPTLIYDSTHPRALREASRSPSLLIFVERLDGTTPEHFDRNWYIHAGHPDGREVESDASRAERHREESEAPDRIYRQNRVVEPLTATAWTIHGYTQLQLGGFLPELGSDPYPRVRGEEDFDRWPPRIIQGFEYRIL